MKFVTVSLFACMICLTANADDGALAAYKRGDYASVVDMATSENASPDALALAARAVLSECIEGGVEPDAKLLKQAESLAARAYNLDSSHVEGRLQLAISLSLQARYMSLSEARKSGYGEQSRDLAESILETDPDNAWAHGFLSVWHVEVRRMGGSIGGAIMGASLDSGEENFRSAMAEDHENILLAWQYARALAGFNAKKYRGEILEILDRLPSITARDALDATVRNRAAELADMLRQGQYDAVEEMALNTL